MTGLTNVAIAARKVRQGRAGLGAASNDAVRWHSDTARSSEQILAQILAQILPKSIALAVGTGHSTWLALKLEAELHIVCARRIIGDRLKSKQFSPVHWLARLHQF